MNIELPKQIVYVGKNSCNYAMIKNNILEIHGFLPFRSLIFKITYQLRGRENCYYCGREIPKKNITLDHIYPQEFGGPSITDNLLPVCSSCNAKKGNMNLDEYVKFMSKQTQDAKRKMKQELINSHKEMRMKKEYGVPKEWITEVKVSNIALRKDIENWNLDENEKTYYRGRKYQKIDEFYKEYGYFKRLVIIDKNYYLLDGAMNVLYALDHNITTVPAIILENVEQFF